MNGKTFVLALVVFLAAYMAVEFWVLRQQIGERTARSAQIKPMGAETAEQQSQHHSKNGAFFLIFVIALEHQLLLGGELFHQRQ